MASLAAILAMGKPVAFEASAELRDTRGFHFYDDAPARVRIYCKLNVGAAGFPRRFADAGDGVVAHFLIFFVGEGLRGCHGDGVARVYAHGIEVFYGADDDDVVVLIAHDFEFRILSSR